MQKFSSYISSKLIAKPSRYPEKIWSIASDHRTQASITIRHRGTQKKQNQKNIKEKKIPFIN